MHAIVKMNNRTVCSLWQRIYQRVVINLILLYNRTCYGYAVVEKWRTALHLHNNATLGMFHSHQKTIRVAGVHARQHGVTLG